MFISFRRSTYTEWWFFDEPYLVIWRWRWSWRTSWNIVDAGDVDEVWMIMCFKIRYNLFHSSQSPLMYPGLVYLLLSLASYWTWYREEDEDIHTGIGTGVDYEWHRNLNRLMVSFMYGDHEMDEDLDLDFTQTLRLCCGYDLYSDFLLFCLMLLVF